MLAQSGSYLWSKKVWINEALLYQPVLQLYMLL